jgi:hypothetical protein
MPRCRGRVACRIVGMPFPGWETRSGDSNRGYIDRYRGMVPRVHVSGWVRGILSAAAVGSVVAAAAWVALADDKAGWTVVAAIAAAVAGGFAPLVLDRLPAAGEFDLTLPEAAVDLAESVLARVQSSPLQVQLARANPLGVRFESATDIGASRAAVTGVRDA